MNTIEAILKVFKTFNDLIGFSGSGITIYDHFNNTHTNEIFAEMRKKSREAYDLYCEYRKYSKKDIGIPIKEKILSYWESCLKHNTLPSVTDMVSLGIATESEAEIMLPCLLEAWMRIPDFVEWLHNILIQNKMDELSQTLVLLQKNLENISELANKLKQQDITSIASIISESYVIAEKHLCTSSDIKDYYRVNNTFPTMIKVISAEQDVPYIELNHKMMELVEGCYPVIIAGNGGLGKTSLMMKEAVQWVNHGRIAVWLSLSNDNIITGQKAKNFFDCLIKIIPDDERVLLCIDNPYEGKVSFLNLQKQYPSSNKIQLILAERANRLTLLTDSDQDALLYWFDNAQMIVLQGLKQSKYIFHLKNYTSYRFSETQERRKKILEKCTSFFVEEGIVKEKDKINTIQTILDKYGKPTVSLVELIYRTLFELKKIESKSGSIKLDWEEWESFIKNNFTIEPVIKLELYGVIAALKIFNTPITITLFCKYFELKERNLKSFLNKILASHHIEPIIFNNNTLQPKHDVIAELFFLFHKSHEEVSINSL